MLPRLLQQSTRHLHHRHCALTQYTLPHIHNTATHTTAPCTAHRAFASASASAPATASATTVTDIPTPTSTTPDTHSPVQPSRRLRPTISMTQKYNTTFKPIVHQPQNTPKHTPYPPELGGKRQVTYTGTVVSAAAQKTISVQVDRYTEIKKYGKLFRHTKKFMTHDEYEEANLGDVVEIRQFRPISKMKSHVLHRVLQRRPQLEFDEQDPNLARRQMVKEAQLGRASKEDIPYP